MADITKQQLLNSVNQTIQGFIDKVATKEDLKAFATKEDLKAFATKDDLRDALRDYATGDDVRTIIREETADIRDEQLRQGVLLDEQGVFLEDLDDKFSALAELVDENLTVKTRVDDHEDRIAAIESKGKIVISTVRHHSAQIKDLQVGQN